MPTSLTEQQHFNGLSYAAELLAHHAHAAGLHAQVSTCPGWTVRDLLAHQGMVHRWATATLRGEDSEATTFEAEGLRATDPVRWFEAGAQELITTLRTVSADVAAPVFLKDPPPEPRAFWVRRQCHETMIHAADALSAELGHAPSAVNFPIDGALAADGIDELLTGFLPRSRSRVHSEQPTTLVIAPNDRDEWWHLAISAGPVVATRHGGPSEEGDWTVRGTAAELYLRLWHRLNITEDAAAWPPDWHENFRISWG